MSMIKCKETGGEIKEKIYRFVYFVLTFALGGIIYYILCFGNGQPTI